MRPYLLMTLLICAVWWGIGTTTIAVQLALAAVRAAPGRPVCLVDFDLQTGDLRTMLDTPPRRSVAVIVNEGASRGAGDATEQFRVLALAAGFAERAVRTN